MNKTISILGLVFLSSMLGTAHELRADTLSPIFQAIRNDDPKKVEELLNKNPELLESTDEFLGFTPLIFVSDENWGNHSLEIVQILLKKHPNLEAKDRIGRTALDAIVSRPHFENSLQIEQALLDNGAKIDAADENGYTPLMLASTAEAASLLLKYKPTIDQTDSWGRTALMLKAMHSDSYSDQVKLLVDAGASLDKIDSEGKRALEFAKVKPADARAYEHPKQWDTIVFLEKAMGLPLDCKAAFYPGIKDTSDRKTVKLLKRPAGKALVGKWVMTESVVNGAKQPPVKETRSHQDSGDMGCNIFSIAQIEFRQDGQIVINDEFKSAFKLFANNPSKVQFKTRDYNRGFNRDSYEGGVYSVEVKEIDGVKVLSLKPDAAIDNLNPMAEYHYVWSGPETDSTQLACDNKDEPGTPITKAAVEDALAGAKQVDATPAQPYTVESKQINTVIPIY